MADAASRSVGDIRGVLSASADIADRDQRCRRHGGAELAFAEPLVATTERMSERTGEERIMADDTRDRGLLVPRQGHAPPRDRLRRIGRRARRDHAGAGAVAGRLRPGQALQDRHAAAAVRRRRRRRQDRAGRPADGGRPHQQERAASTAGRSRSWSPDDESKPDVGRRKTEKLLVEDKVDAHVGGFLSNICLACMPVFEENKVVNMISVCLDTTLTTTKCNRYSFRPLRLRAGAGGGVRALPRQQDGQEVAHRLCRLLLGPVDPRRLRRRRSRRRAARSSAPPAFRSAPPT